MTILNNEYNCNIFIIQYSSIKELIIYVSKELTDTEKRDRIMEAAKELILHYGYKKTTMQDIADKAEISVGTIYNFFENKDDIAIECGKKFKDHLIRETSRSP